MAYGNVRELGDALESVIHEICGSLKDEVSLGATLARTLLEDLKPWECATSPIWTYFAVTGRETVCLKRFPPPGGWWLEAAKDEWEINEGARPHLEEWIKEVVLPEMTR